MANIDEILQSMTAETSEKRIPGVALAAVDRNGQIVFSKSAGLRSLDPEKEAKPFSIDTVCWAASMTKLMTSVAAMQCVEQGLVTLDEDISRILPEYKTPQILVGFDKENGNKPILEDAKNKLTLRHLLTHSSGIAYEFTSPKFNKWREWQKENTKPGEINPKSMQAFVVPLLFEPGEGWTYGYSLDWVGEMVTRLHGNIRLGEYMAKNIWGPVGMTDTTFDIDSRPDLQARLSDSHIRIGEGAGQTIYSDFSMAPKDLEFDMGGGGTYSCATDYIKLLTSLLKNDGKLLQSHTLDEMFRPQLDNHTYLKAVTDLPINAGIAGNLPLGFTPNWGLAGIINMEDTPIGRTKGTMQWSGLPNCFWWINRTCGVAGCYFSQLYPPGDMPSFELYRAFEQHVNKNFKPKQNVASL